VSLGIAVIGAGRVGSRRAASAAKHSRLEVIADIELERAESLAARYGARYTARWEEAAADRSVDVVVICTTNNLLAPIAISSLQQGKHVLCEKPMGRNAAEATQMNAAAESSGCILKIGFTLRFHPAIRRAHELCMNGSLGPLYFVHSIYGHGGRVGYDKEWRGDVELAGGGELLDQGVHLLDLARWFLGDLEVVAAITPRWYWNVAPLEDNALMLLRGQANQTASLHTSWTMWKNRFAFDVFGRDGYARVEGLGGSYGIETLTVGRRSLDGSVPEETVANYGGPDLSWEADWLDLIASINDDRKPEVDGAGGVAVMGMVEAVYSAAAPARGGIRLT
jgi:predicted dehydrogenase